MANAYINYVEPNYNFNKGGKEQQVPLEDLCVVVDLCVEVPPLQFKGQVQQDSTTYLVSWTSTDKTTSMSFFHGTKNPTGDDQRLSTNYTKATYEDLKYYATNELFGISSIDIQYQSYFTPQITIEFVDIRGASLFGLEEMRHPGINGYVDDDVAGSFFRCFFVQPWPRFTLLVKGFYGQPVTYTLACQSFQARFDSKTGNFKATVKFVGYTFGFLGDVALSPLLASPNSPFYGQEYWKAQCANNRFTVDGVEMPNVSEILRRYGNLTAELNSVISETAEQQALNNTDSGVQKYDELLASYDAIYSAFKSAVDKIPAEYKGNIYTNSKNSKTFILLVEDEDDDDLDETIEDNTKKAVEDYKAFKTLCSDNNVPAEKIPFFNFEFVEKWTEDDGVKVSAGYDQQTQVTEFIKKKRSEATNENNKPKDNEKAAEVWENTWGEDVDELRGIETNEMGFVDYINEKKNELNANKSQQEEALVAKKNEVISTSLGFRPTIYNITKILMAHLETLIYEITECHNKIYSTSRTCDDILKTGGGAFCVPFPQVLKLATNKDSNSQSLETAWIGEVSGNHPDAYERDLIEGLIKGVEELAKAALEAQAMQAMADAMANGETNTEVLVRPFLPSDVLDPKIWEAVDDTNIQSIGNAILLRAMGVFSTHRKGSTYDSSAKDIGKTDAESFLKLFPYISTNIGAVIGNLTSSNIISSGVSSNIIIEANSKLHIKGNVIPITHIDTKTTNMVNSSGIIQETQHPEYYVKWGSGAEKYKTFDICTGTNAEKFFNNKSLSGVSASQKVATGMDGNYTQWYNNGQIGVLIGKNFQPTDKIAVDYTPTTSNGLFADTREKMKTQNDDVFKSENEDKWAQWASDGWGFDQLKTTQGVLKRSGSFTDCLTSYEKFKELIGGYTLTMFNGVNWTDSKNQLRSCVGVSVFTQKLFVSSTNIHFKAYLFLESCISHKSGINGLNYGSSLIGKIKDGWVKTCPYLLVLYVGALKSADYECKNYDHIKNKKNTIFGNTNPVFAEACYKEFKEWVTNYFSSTILGNYKVPKDEGAIEIIGERFKKYDNTKLCSTIASWFEDKIFQHYISFKPANASNNEAVDFTQPKERTYGFRLMVRPNDTSKDIVKNLFQPCVIVQHSSSQGVEKSTFPEIAPPGISKSTVQSYIDGFIEVISAASASNNATTVTNNTATSTTTNNTTTPGNTATGNTAATGATQTKSIKAAKESATGTTTGTTTATTETNTTEAGAAGDNGTISEETTTATNMSGMVESFETDNLVKASFYEYIKVIYDKWLKGNIGYCEDIGGFAKIEEFFDQHFHFIDTFYNYATDVFIDLHHFCSAVFQSNTQGSYGFVNFLSSIYSKGFAMYTTQNFMDYNDPELMQSMFQPIPYIEMKRPSITDMHIDFVIVKQNEVSHQLHMLDENGEDMDDSFMLGDYVEDCLLPVPITSKTAAQRPSYLYQDPNFLNKFDTPNHVYKIPCFGVAYGKQYENYFMEVDVSTDNHVATNESLNAELRIMSEAKPQFMPDQPENASNTTIQFLSQDLFSVFMNNSYTCTIKMMGCAWVQPLMYFCLTNVPMFRGAYQIINVTHSITPGNMTTTFKGIRMAKTSLPHVDKMLVRSIDHGGGVGADGSFDQTTLANIDNDCGYKYFNPFYSGVGGSLGEILKKCETTTLSQLIPDGGTRSYTKGEKGRVTWRMYANYTLMDILIGMVYCEYGHSEYDLDRDAVAATMYNRLMKYNCDLQRFFIECIGWQSYAVVMWPNGIPGASRPAHDAVARCKNEPKWGKSRESLLKVWGNSPMCLVGTTTTLEKSKPVPIYVNKRPTSSMTCVKQLTERDVKYAWFFATTDAYKKRHGPDGYEYLFQNNEHVFSTAKEYHEAIDKGYMTASQMSNSSSSGEKEKEITNKEKLEKIIGAIGQTVSHSTTIGFNQIYHKMSGDNGAYVSTSANHTEDPNNATLFDIIYNTYYGDLDKIEWCTKDANSSGGECRGVYIELNGGAKSIGVSHSGGYVPDNLTEKDGKVTGIMNEKFYKALGKKFRQVNESNKKAFLEIKNYKDSDINKFNKLIGNYIPQPCPTPSLGGDAGGGANYIPDGEPITPPANLKMNYSGNFPYAGSPFTLNDLNKDCGNKSKIQGYKNQLSKLVKNILHPIYDILTFYPNSTFRCKTDSSQHNKGEACDMHPGTVGTKNNTGPKSLKLFDTTYQLLEINHYSDWGQMLYEVHSKKKGCPSHPRWTHISLGSRKQIFGLCNYTSDGIKSYTIPHPQYVTRPKKTQCNSIYQVNW